MSFEQAMSNLVATLYNAAPSFALVFVRVTGLFIFAPLFGSMRVPRRVKLLLAIALALAISGGVALPSKLPDSTWEVAAGMSGELLFGLAIGMIVSLVFVAAQWAGEMIGQQMGLNLSQVFDPQFGGAGSLIGDMYFMFALVTFIIMNGHHALLRGLRFSFDAVPLLSAGIDRSMFDLLLGLLTSATVLAIQLAAPMLVTMLVVDLALGCISKTMPQMNIMTAGLTIRAIVGVVVLMVGIVLTGRVFQSALSDALATVEARYAAPM